MTNCSDFHTQLVCIMDVLAKAAVADICKLVDDGYTILRLEVSRSQKENQTLKKRLQMLELMIARGCADPRIAAHEDEPAVPGEDDQFCNAPRLFDSQPAVGLWRDGDIASVEKLADEGQHFELRYIKEETAEDDLEEGDLQEVAPGMCGAGTDSAEDCRRSPESNTRTVAAEDKAELTEHPSVWKDALLKVEAPSESSKQGSRCIQKLNELVYEPGVYESPGSAEMLPNQMVHNTDAGHEGLLAHSEPRCFSVAPADVCGTSRSFGARARYPETNSVLQDMDCEARASWWTESPSESSYTQHGRCKEQVENGHVHLEHVAVHLSNPREAVAGPPPEFVPYSQSFASLKSPKSQRRGSAGKEKRFTCTYCGKSFSCPNHLKTHRRIHTGEKPFSCNQCGKRFSDSSNVKRHQNTHTGNKPFVCTLCGRGFSQSGCLITHQRVHTGEKPFSCTQCGKRFSDSSNLKRHENTHVGKKACVCAR